MGTLSTLESTHLRQHVKARALGDVRADLGEERAEVLHDFLGGTRGYSGSTLGYSGVLGVPTVGTLREI